MSAFRSPRQSRRSNLWQRHDASDEDQDIYDDAAASSPLVPRSSSTPYHLYKSRASGIGASHDEYEDAATTPSAKQRHSHGQQRTPRPSYSNSPHLPTAASAQSVTPIRAKNTSFGSPGLRASSSASARLHQRGEASVGLDGSNGSPASGSASKPPRKPKPRTSARFVRRKTFEQRIKELPTDLLDRAVSLGFTIAEYLADPALGYPLGIVLHVFALLSHLISPASELSLTLLLGLDPADRRGTSLFADHHKRRGGGGGGATSELRRAVAQNRLDAWTWLAASISFAVFAVSVYNAYHLVSARRRYRLWMRSPMDKVTSQNARLVPINLDEEAQGPTWQERLIAFTLRRLQRIPILGWFIPNPPNFEHDHAHEAQIHELNVWEAPEVSLRVAVVFSPLHALLWHIAGSSLLPISGLPAWVTFFTILALITAQSLLISTLFSQLIKDKGLLAAEVMKEYDQKFVLPRAMPSVRDASTMTDESFLGNHAARRTLEGTAGTSFSSSSPLRSMGTDRLSSPASGLYHHHQHQQRHRQRHSYSQSSPYAGSPGLNSP